MQKETNIGMPGSKGRTDVLMIIRGALPMNFKQYQEIT